MAVYVLPLRNVFEVARATGTLAILSNHRFILGAGTGWMKDEFDIYGVDFHTRGKRFDESSRCCASSGAAAWWSTMAR